MTSVINVNGAEHARTSDQEGFEDENNRDDLTILIQIPTKYHTTHNYSM